MRDELPGRQMPLYYYLLPEKRGKRLPGNGCLFPGRGQDLPAGVLPCGIVIACNDGRGPGEHGRGSDLIRCFLGGGAWRRGVEMAGDVPWIASLRNDRGIACNDGGHRHGEEVASRRLAISDEAIQTRGHPAGLLRPARNDGGGTSNPDGSLPDQDDTGVGRIYTGKGTKVFSIFFIGVML